MERVEDGSTSNGAQIMEADGDTSDRKAVWRGQGADPQKGCGRDHYCYGFRTGRRAGGEMDS